MRYCASGTLTATTSGVEIPTTAALRAGCTNYLIRIYNNADATTGVPVFFCDSDAPANAANGDGAPPGGGHVAYLWESNGPSDTTRSQPKVYASTSQAFYWSMHALTAEQ